jgi:hypothetical protein
MTLAVFTSCSDDDGSSGPQDDTLLTIDVPADALNRDGSQGFIFLSDENGKTLVNHEYTAGESITLEASEFTGDEFYVTEVYIGKDDQELRTFSKVRRGKWVLTPADDGENQAYAGDASVSFTNALPGVSYQVISNGDYSLVSDNTALTASLRLRQTPSKLFITRAEDDLYPTHYALIPTISIGAGNTPISLGLVSNALTAVSKDIDSEYTQGQLTVVGLAAEDQYDDRYIVYQSDLIDGKIEYRYPGKAFPAYFSTTQFAADDGHFYDNANKGLPDVTPLASVVDVVLTDKKVTGSVTGNTVDVVVVSYQTVYRRWNLYGPKGQLTMALPEIPSEINALLTGDFSNPRISISALDLGAIDGYDGLQEYIKKSTTGLFEIYEFYYPYKRMYVPLAAGSGGRIPQRQGRRVAP